ncbi:pleckstrin homology domain-containing family b member 2-like [Plakobranchus ocellatus]|uniref:Pleckstrin homology domain-containing family b member 2-like n=1 Tax=Plakobranchus ocellatus TaxID=259542 RepID=A0AAV4BTP5_9GAST|nr:pleckstrin homology domain-containing family b member 2-like [Plakobranchus ocellatus]
MASGGYDIAKAGWLYRQSSVLHRWKKNWFVLDRQGDLRYFESPDSPKAEERIVIRACVAQINSGKQCRSADPPDERGYTKEGLLELLMKGKESLLLCAESVDDMRAWQIALEEARTLSFQARHPGVVNTTTLIASPGYSPYGYSYGYEYPGQVINTTGYSTQQVLHTPTGTTTIVNGHPGQQIVYVDDCPRRRRYYRGGIYPVPLFFW